MVSFMFFVLGGPLSAEASGEAPPRKSIVRPGALFSPRVFDAAKKKIYHPGNSRP
jgi:hypothetical protein